MMSISLTSQCLGQKVADFVTGKYQKSLPIRLCVRKVAIASTLTSTVHSNHLLVSMLSFVLSIGRAESMSDVEMTRLKGLLPTCT